MSKHSEMHAALELVDELEAMGVERRFAVIQAADEWGFAQDDIELALNAKKEREGGMTRIDLEIEAKLKDGRLVHIVGYVNVYDNCQCHEGEVSGTQGPHRHVDGVEIESVIQLFDAGTVDGGEITLNSREYNEVEQILESEAYTDVA